jgi:hypothetical protein
VQFIYGHFHINWKAIGRDFDGRQKRFFIFLRDPIERMWSWYHHTNGPRNYGSIVKWLESSDT